MALFGTRTFMAAMAISFALGGGQGLAQDAQVPLSSIVDDWLASPHADRSAEAFIHWNEDGEIPGTCAVCHSSIGIIDYLRTTQPVPGMIDHPVGLGSTVECSACHGSGAANLQSVPFPSGVSVDTFGKSAVCTVCHQGRASTITVEAATAGLADDVVSADLGFINIHYAPSAATLMGGVVKGGFQYPGKDYKGQFAHVPNQNTCVDCHNPHTLEVSFATCTTCHQAAQSFADIRTTPTDFDGDGNTTEGISNAISTFHARLGAEIQRYAAQVPGTAIAYNIDAYPYFFVDGDADGTATEAEAVFPNRYQSWTPRLLKAAYNYQLVAKDPAIYTHNPHYALQLLYDSIEDLAGQTQADLSDLVRP